jgi:hypothetical protein
VLLLAWPVDSYVQALTYPGDASFSVRTVEWVRDNGGSGLVDLAENWWYSRPHTIDPQPGGAAGAVSPLDNPVPSTSRGPASNAPAPLPALAGAPAPPGEGVWAPRATSTNGSPAIYATFVRPDIEYSWVTAGVALINQNLTRAVLIAGTRQPDQSTRPADAQVPSFDRAALLGAFNSGFKMKDARGGFFLKGRTYLPLRNGAASLVIRTDGRATVAQWGRDAAAGPDVVAVRQSLDLIVDGGHPVPGLTANAGGAWGSARNQLQYTWRSGVGIDGTGNLLYVGGANLTLATLAEALTTAGAVRAMQLDIHPNMIDFYTYLHTGRRLTPTKLLSYMPNADTRYLAPDQRDFVAVLSR